MPYAVAALPRPPRRTHAAGFAEDMLGRRLVRAGGPPASAEGAAPADDPPRGALGVARAQVFDTYILAQAADRLVIVDQHAAHERLVYERLKAAYAAAGAPAQLLLIPEVVELAPTDATRLLAAAEDLARLGLTLEPFGGAAVCVRATPALLGPVDAPALLSDLADALAEGAPGTGLGRGSTRS